MITQVQQTSSRKPFRYFMQVRYAECDAQQVVFNARYGDYIDLATTEFFDTVIAEQSSTASAFDYQVVKLTIEWKAPARYKDTLELSVSVTHLGNTSFTLTINIINAKTGQFLANGEIIGVAVDPETLEKVSIPLTLKTAMQTGGEDRFIDHAGLFTAQQTI